MRMQSVPRDAWGPAKQQGTALRAMSLLRVILAVVLLLAVPRVAATASQMEPDVPRGKDPGGVAVAIIDSGVNYTLHDIASRLARDENGECLGYDFHDNDRKPFDLVPGQKLGSGRHHGTRVAGIFLREAPDARLIPYRYRAHSFETFATIVDEVAKSPARIVIMALGGYQKKDWERFRKAAEARPDILFIISAGNDGRNVDDKPMYPSGFRLDNALVVASTDTFGRLPLASNWGPETVDVSTPGEGIETFDHTGAKTFVSGSSFAVPRIAALAARFKAINPDWTTQDLKSAIVALAGPSPGDRTKRTKFGWIANPALAGPATE